MATDTFSDIVRSVGITFATIMTSDPVMRAAMERAESAAKYDSIVLILGESGTGKNLLAQAVHNGSRRSNGPYVGLNCSAVPDTLIESELFGHEKGAFTSADRQRRGAFERADGGTLFLDEIGDMSPLAQTKVLHAIEYKQFARVGGEAILTSDVRFIAATNRDLMQAVDEKGFRGDLYYRLAEVVVQIPPLRRRKQDIPLYANLFLEEANLKYGMSIRKVSKSAISLLQEHDWPGNVRELRSCIRQAAQMCDTPTLDANDIHLRPKRLPDSQDPSSEPAARGGGELDLQSMEKEHIQRVLLMCDWKKKEAARLLGISRPTLDRKIDLYDLKRDE